MAVRIIVAAAVVLASMAQAVPAQAQSLPHAPPTSCEIRQSSWCILYSDATYEDAPSQEQGYASRWTIRGGTWKDHPLIINEPLGCRIGQADTLELVEDEKKVEWQGRSWTKSAIKLKKNGSCNLEFLYPSSTQDPQEGAFLAAMTLIKACRDAVCGSPPIGLIIRPRIHR